MKFIRKEIPNIDFAILTGDVPPHDTWLETKETVTPILEHSYSLIESFLGKGTNLYPAIGNHDAGPTKYRTFCIYFLLVCLRFLLFVEFMVKHR
jgi:sphingomyelin phosphodiesterase